MAEVDELEKYELYTVIDQSDNSIKKCSYRLDEIEAFKKQAEGKIYYMSYEFSSEVVDWYHGTSDRYSDYMYLNIPVHDYVIRDGKLAGFYISYSYPEFSSLTAEYVNRALHKEVGPHIIWLDRGERKGFEIQFSQMGKWRDIPRREWHELQWRLRIYEKEGRLDGTNTAYRWDEKDTMVIMGQGDVRRTSLDWMPWRYFEDQIKTLVVLPGITGIGDISNCKSLKTIILPGTLEMEESPFPEYFYEKPFEQCKVYVLAGSVAAGYSWPDGMEKVLLDVNEDCRWLQDKYNFDLKEDYEKLWKRNVLKYLKLEEKKKEQTVLLEKEVEALYHVTQETEKSRQLLYDMERNSGLSYSLEDIRLGKVTLGEVYGEKETIQKRRKLLSGLLGRIMDRMESYCSKYGDDEKK